LELDHVGVKSPQFSYNRIKGSDPVAGVEMASTGEVACIGDDLLEAFYNSWLSTDQWVRGRSVFLSLPEVQKHKVVDEVRALANKGWQFFTTAGTHDFLKQQGIKTKKLYKLSDKREPSVASAIRNHKIDLIINVPTGHTNGTGDGYPIRRLGIDHRVPVVTNAEIGKTLLKCLAEFWGTTPEPKSWQDYA
jgi:hypothetical protein